VCCAAGFGRRASGVTDRGVRGAAVPARAAARPDSPGTDGCCPLACAAALACALSAPARTRAPSHALCPFAAADYNLTPRDRPKLYVQCADAPRAALLEREAGLVAALASAEQVGPGVLVSAIGLGLGVE